MAKESLFDHDSLAGDDRNFKEQMMDLCVPVEPLHKDGSASPSLAGVEWLEWTGKGGRQRPLVNCLSLRINGISVGEVALEKMARDIDGDVKTLSFGTAVYQSKKVLLVRVNPGGDKGCSLRRSKHGPPRAGTKNMSKKLMEKGLAAGNYRLGPKITGVPGGWITIPEAE